MSFGHLFGNPCFIDSNEQDVCVRRTAAKGGRPVTFAIAAKETRGVTLSTCPCFSLGGKEVEVTAKDMWAELKDVNFLSIGLSFPF